MKVKVCGIASLEQLSALQAIGVDYVGMIFYERSKRFIGEMSESDKRYVRQLAVAKIGVFVNASLDRVKQAISDFDLQAVQLHGVETPEFCKEILKQVQVIKAFSMSAETDVDGAVASYKDACDFYLFDTATATHGGSGKKFDWQQLRQAHISKPFFLSGGISADDIEPLRQFKHPFLYAVDINSRFETAPGYKDLKSVQTFVGQLKEVAVK